MTDKLIVPVPDKLTASFVVAFPHLHTPGLDQLAAMLCSSDTMPQVDLFPYIEIRRADVQPIPWLAQLFSYSDRDQADPALADRIPSIGTYISVECSGTPGWPPLHVPLAAAMAEAQAILTGGIPIDADNAVLLSREYITYPLIDPKDFAVAGWIKITVTPGENGLLLQTIGLARLGLPELSIEEIPRPLAQAWGHVLNGLAQCLLTRWWQLTCQWPSLETALGQPFWEIEPETTITMADIDAALASRHQRPAASVTIRLNHQIDDADAQPVLTVCSPDGTSGATAQQWHHEVVRQLNLLTM